MPNDTAASDLIATMALIAVFVTAMAILGVTLLASPPGDAAPAMLARSVTEDGRLSIHHDGGDPLDWEHVAILIDGVDRTGEFSLVDVSGGEHDTWTSWETGQVLVLSGVPEDAHVQIVAGGVDRTGSDWLLHDFGNGSAVGPTATATTVPTGTSTTVPTTIPTTIPTTEPTQVPLVAGFTADTTSGPAPLSVQFNDASTGGATSWFWDFGDGGNSTDQNPIHVYISPGTYTVTLAASNAHGNDTETRPGYITVAAPLIADFTANVTTGPAPLTVQFTDFSSGDGITSWSWDFGDGSTSSVQNPVHTYGTDGTYNVSLTVENAHGSDTVTKSNYITVAAEHVSQLEVNSVRQVRILFWSWYTPVNDIEIDYSGELGAGSDRTPFVLSKTAPANSGFSVTLAAPDEIQVWLLIFPTSMEFDHWEVGENTFGSRIVDVSIPDRGSETATAYYRF